MSAFMNRERLSAIMLWRVSDQQTHCMQLVVEAFQASVKGEVVDVPSLSILDRLIEGEQPSAILAQEKASHYDYVSNLSPGTA